MYSNKNYFNLYKKYKGKYCLLKRQVGGTALLNEFIKRAVISENGIEEIKKKMDDGAMNLGQYNCGIVFYGPYVIKCSIGYDEVMHLKEKQALIHKWSKYNRDLEFIYPKIYLWPNGDPYMLHKGKFKMNKFEIMERLEGDLTELILKTSFKLKYGNLDRYQYFYDRLPKTTIRFVETDLEEYETMKDEIKPHLIEFVKKLDPEVTRLHHNLIIKGYRHTDLKLDNLAYRIEGNNSKIKLYFIDIESGLNEINSNPEGRWEPVTYQDYLELHSVGSELINYYLLGQYNLKNIFKINNNDLHKLEPSEKEFNRKEIIDRLKELSFYEQEDKEHEDSAFWNYIKFQKPGHNYFIVIQFCNGLYRLVRFDDYGRHVSNPEYNNHFEPIEELYEKKDDLYSKVSEL